MKETLKHWEAFDYYYSLGDKRSYPQVADRFTVSETSVKKWAKNFDWQARVVQRDDKNARKLEEMTDNTIIAERARYRKEIKENLRVIQDSLAMAVKLLQDKNPMIGARSPQEIAQLTRAYESMAKLDLLLMGEPTERPEVKGIPIREIRVHLTKEKPEEDETGLD